MRHASHEGAACAVCEDGCFYSSMPLAHGGVPPVSAGVAGCGVVGLAASAGVGGSVVCATVLLGSTALFRKEGAIFRE